MQEPTAPHLIENAMRFSWSSGSITREQFIKTIEWLREAEKNMGEEE